MANKHLIRVCAGTYCAEHKGKKVARRLREALDAMGDGQAVRVKTCDCMGRCKKGPHVVFPKGNLAFAEVKPGDAGKVAKKILKILL